MRWKGGKAAHTNAALFWVQIIGRLDDGLRLKVVWATVDPIKRGKRFQLKPLLILLTPITHSRPIRTTIPDGAIAGTDTGGDGGASATTTKPGDPLSSPSVNQIHSSLSQFPQNLVHFFYQIIRFDSVFFGIVDHDSIVGD